MSKLAMTAIVLASVVATGVLAFTMPDPPTPATPVCGIEDEVISVKDEYNGAWSGVDRSVYWKSGAKEIKSGDNLDEYYVGKKICREYK